MIVSCDKCGKRFDDYVRSWVCPHKRIDGVCDHDLMGTLCTLCYPEKVVVNK